MTYGIPYSVSETDLVIRLRESGFVGQRLTDQFRAKYPDRSHTSVLSKVEQLRRKKVIR